MIGTGGVVHITPSAESPSRDFGSIIFNIGDAGDHLSWRPAQSCKRRKRPTQIRENIRSRHRNVDTLIYQYQNIQEEHVRDHPFGNVANEDLILHFKQQPQF